MKYLTFILLVTFVGEACSQNKVLPLILEQGQKASFSTGSQYWTKSSPSGLNFSTGTNFSIIVSFKTNTPTSVQRLIALKSGSSGAGDPGFILELRSSKVSFVIGDAAGTTASTASITLTQGTKYFVVVTVNRTGNAIIYTNGVFDYQFSISTIGSVDNALPLGIGASGAGAAIFNGAIGNMQIVSGKVFTATEVADLYARRNMPLQKQYSSGTVVIDLDWNYPGQDLSGTGNNLSPTGGPVIMRFR